MDDQTPASTHITLRLLERFAADDAADGLRPLAEYVADFPRHTELVATEHAAWLAARAAHRGAAKAQNAGADTLGPYRIERALGRGGQGIVYQALDTRLGRRVALKVLDAPTWGESGTGPPRVLAREVEALARLDDPRIAGVLEAGTEDGRAYLTTRLVDGPSLGQLLAAWREDGGPPLDERLALGLALAEALAAAHARGVVHRDVKPANVLVEETPGGLRPVLIDFGLARAVDAAGPRHTLTGDQLGTPRYMAPERLVGGGHDDPRADVWALGVLLHELVTYRAPFEGQTFETVARRIERDAPPRLADGRGGSTRFARKRDLEALLERALEKAPHRRYADAGALADDLARLVSGRPLKARPLGPVARGVRWVERHPAQALIAVLLVLLAGGSTWSALRLDRAGKLERSAREDATASLARAEADRAHLVLEGGAPGRFTRARTHLEAATASNTVPGPDDRSELRSDFVRALTGTDLVPRPTAQVGGLGIVKLDPEGRRAAAFQISPQSRELLLDVHATAPEGARAEPAATHVVRLPAASTAASTLLAVHAQHLALAEPGGVRLVDVPRLLDRQRAEAAATEALEQATDRVLPAPPGTAPEVAASRVHDFAQFDAAGDQVVVAAGAAWTLHWLGASSEGAADLPGAVPRGAAIATGTADVPLEGLAAFSPDGRWLVVRQEPALVILLDRARNPVRISFEHPVLAAVPFDGDVPKLGLLLARPNGLEVGVWEAPIPEAERPGYRRLTGLQGGSAPVPRLALHGEWLAASSTRELVVVAHETGRVPGRIELTRTSALEGLAWRTRAAREASSDGARARLELQDLELLFHRRSAPLLRFGFERAIDWQTQVEPADPAHALRGEAPEELERHVSSLPSPSGAPQLTAVRLAFPGADLLELAAPGQALYPNDGGKLLSPLHVAEWHAERPAIAAATVAIVDATAIRPTVHVWLADRTEPWDHFELQDVMGVGALALSADGRWLAAVTANGRLVLRDVAARAFVFDVPLELEVPRDARGVLDSAWLERLAFEGPGALHLQTKAGSWRFDLAALDAALEEHGLGWLD